jgi:hypothetical protein
MGTRTPLWVVLLLCLVAVAACATGELLPPDAGQPSDGAIPDTMSPSKDGTVEDHATEDGTTSDAPPDVFDAGVPCTTDGSVTFNSNGTAQTGTVQTWTVPSGVCQFTIDALGAQGGSSKGGLGAEMKGDFTVPPGHTLNIVVGQQGTTDTCGGGAASGGGGGGTFVWDGADAGMPLVAAGGGGGGNVNWSNTICAQGVDAVTTTDGTAGYGTMSAAGGTGGNGGAGNAPSGTGAGGGGWLSNGGTSTFDATCTGGQCATSTSPFAGGNGSTTYGPGGYGGYGGGGGAVCGCGGGGGYSGGGAGEGSSCRAGGGGGGSYNGGTSQVNTASVQTGDGKVTISW